MKYLGIFCFFLILLVLLANICIVRKKDFDLYNAIIASSQAQKMPTNAFCEQEREKVSKELWYQKDKTLLSAHVKYARSTVHLSRLENNFELVEYMDKVFCMAQQKLYFTEDKPMQQIFCLESRTGSYHYNAQKLTLEDVNLCEYHIEGHTLPIEPPNEKPTLRAVAKSAQLNLENGKPFFTAEKMHAVLSEPL